MSFIINTYNRLPIKITKAKGIYIYDDEGRKYIDTFSGIGVLAFGHGDSFTKKAIREKMEKFLHVSNFFLDEDAEFVSQFLVQQTHSPGKVYFGNSGAEANEAALKAIKKVKEGIIISFEENFHGRTLGALSITGFPGIRKPFEPLLKDIMFLPFNDSDYLEKFFKNNGEKVAAVFLETIHGSGGIKLISEEFSNVLMNLKEKYNFLLITDEVQSGIGRTGKFYSFQHFNLKPDIITVSKALGGGLPLSATIFLENLSNVFRPGEHGSTFAPNPLALAASKVILNRITPDLLKKVRENGEYLKHSLIKLMKKYNSIVDVRGKGLMAAFELKNIDSNKLLFTALNNGLLINVLKEKIVRLLPPLNITKEEIDEIISKLDDTLNMLYL
ncbi:aspartate aminotransferase family protein [Thermosipho ferrireducens]|uniref:aspartate aminotransferase family protein n=1 Tax=Thermosipho ferrireducens TaxID=2571116 RepID=UPI001D185D56|nr:aminotransferase class III-fold pyridoxal phosphate-dependent enzyme [Thermosipho ferrireducens]